jgi:hypothetical protein
VQLGKVLFKWLAAVCSDGKPVTALMIIEKCKSFYDEIKITDKCTFSVDSNKK